MAVERFPWQPPIAKDILAAAEETGYGVSEDLNGHLFKGFSVAQTNSEDGARVSSSRAFLSPARTRRNLHVALNATATKIFIRDSRAVAVRFYQVSNLEF